jgi:hypothetical protein
VLVSSTVDSPWTAQEQGWMLALAEYEASRCDGCGNDLHESLDSEMEEWAVEPIRCGACTRLAVAQDAHAKDHKHMNALRWRVWKRKR